MARWAAKPIDLGYGDTITPWVIGPDKVPVIDDEEQAQTDPELAALSVTAHGQDRDVDKATRIAGAVLGICSGLGAEREELFFELTQLSINEDIRRRSKEMQPAVYRFQSDFALKHYGEGKAEGRRETLIPLLSMRFGPLGQAALSRMFAASNAELEAIAERLLVAPTLEDALGVIAEGAS